ncbi:MULTISPECIES: hypothetical protein [unclassified Oceanobacter]|uniref:hypothetical protein n=1 Tax=unclassified Oceanobacter TaxID=2620260 RepID=UPI0027352397|nr:MULTISPECIES: hypothetical protein [unclassified Oceanobacter]MDP2608905.1 hypothetical protein [Oceanobacter sp. 1_MG-2023]MDP2612110.1 hypothetical protein [Oceanobacter sp. 2_MG-2023]
MRIKNMITGTGVLWGRTSVIAVALAIGLSGCATTSGGPSLSPKGEAIYDTLALDTRLRTWADSCTHVSYRADKAAQLARQNWWNRNGSLVKSADYGLAYDLVTITDIRQPTGARLAMALTWGIVEAAEQEVAAALADKENQESRCLEVLDAFDRGDLDLADREVTYKALLEMQHHRDMKGDALLLREAAVEKQTGKVYGRSYYVVEKLTQHLACPGAEVSLLSSAWPDEVYQARCEDASFLLLRCEWGNCRVVK